MFLNVRAEHKVLQWHGEAGVGIGNYTSFIYAVRGDFFAHHSFSLSYYSHRRTAENVPDAFSGFRVLGNGKPKEKVRFLALSYGRIIDVVPKVKLNLKAGVLGGETKTFDNFQHKSGFIFVTDNYTYDIHYAKIAGITLNPALEVNVSKTVGISLGIYSVFISKLSLYGVELKTIIF